MKKKKRNRAPINWSQLHTANDTIVNSGINNKNISLTQFNWTIKIKMSFEFIKTKEEFVNYEEDFKIENLSDIEEENCVQELNKMEMKENVMHEDFKTKCGEIFISSNGKLYFACDYCDLNLKKVEVFKNHIFTQHLNLEEDYEFEDSSNISGSEINEDDEKGSSEIKDECISTSFLGKTPIKVEDSLDDVTLSGSNTFESQNDNSNLTQPALPEMTTTLATSKIEAKSDTALYCDICNKQYRTIKGLARHRVGHDVTGTSDTTMLSDHRDDNASTKDVMMFSDNHDSEDESKPNIPVKTNDNSLKCSYCNKHVRYKVELIYHERSHTGEKPYKCTVCGNNFRSNRQLKSHMRTHTGERPYSCPHCPGKFSSSANRDVHVRAHLGIKRYTCELCNKAFVTNYQLTVHIRSHTGEKPYQCELCDANFITASKLREHKKRHTNTKPHKCDICSKCFYSKGLLKGHQTTHSDKRPFACDICAARFARKRALQSHIKIHSDVKEFTCNICGKAFSQYSGLYCHMRTHGNKTKEVERALE